MVPGHPRGWGRVVVREQWGCSGGRGAGATCLVTKVDGFSRQTVKSPPGPRQPCLLLFLGQRQRWRDSQQQRCGWIGRWMDGGRVIDPAGVLK